MSRLNVMIEDRNDREYANWISLDFDPDDESDLKFALELQRRAVDQGYRVNMTKDEE